MISLEQIRAHRAFGRADDIAEKWPEKEREKFLSLARSLPAMFQNNGFLATWAFLLSKGEKEHKAVLSLLITHLKSEDFDLNLPRNTDDAHELLMYWTDRNLSNEHLMELTREALIFSGWIKRAAEALCDQ